MVAADLLGRTCDRIQTGAHVFWGVGGFCLRYPWVAQPQRLLKVSPVKACNQHAMIVMDSANPVPPSVSNMIPTNTEHFGA